jgi:hypothetical protein
VINLNKDLPPTVHRYYVVRVGKPALVTVTLDRERDVLAELPYKTEPVLLVSAGRRPGVALRDVFAVQVGAGLGVRAQVDSGALRVLAVDAEGGQTTIVIFGPGHWNECTPVGLEPADDPADVLADVLATIG